MSHGPNTPPTPTQDPNARPGGFDSFQDPNGPPIGYGEQGREQDPVTAPEADQQPIETRLGAISGEELQAQREAMQNGANFDLTDYRTQRMEILHAEYAGALAKRSRASYQLRGKKHLQKLESAYHKAIFDVAESRAAVDIIVNPDGSRGLVYDATKANSQALEILLFEPNENTYQFGKLFSLNQAQRDKRLEQTGRYVKNTDVDEHGRAQGVIEKDAGRFKRVVNGAYDKWGEWGQQGFKGTAKKIATTAVAGATIGAALGPAIGAIGGAVAAAGASRLVKGAASMKMNKKARETYTKIDADYSTRNEQIRELENPAWHGEGPLVPQTGNAGLDYSLLKDRTRTLINETFTKKTNKEHRRNFISTTAAIGSMVVGGALGAAVHEHASEIGGWISDRARGVANWIASHQDISAQGKPNVITGMPNPNGDPTTIPPSEMPKFPGDVPPIGSRPGIDTIDRGTSNARDGYSGVRTPELSEAQQKLIDQMKGKSSGDVKSAIDEVLNSRTPFPDKGPDDLIAGHFNHHGAVTENTQGLKDQLNAKVLADKAAEKALHGPDDLKVGTGHTNSPKPDLTDRGTSNARDGYSGVRTPDLTPQQHSLIDQMNDKNWAQGHQGADNLRVGIDQRVPHGIPQSPADQQHILDQMNQKNHELVGDNGPDDNLPVDGGHSNTPSVAPEQPATPNTPSTTPNTPATPNSTFDIGVDQQPGVKTVDLNSLDKTVPAKIYTQELGSRGYQQMLDDARVAIKGGDLEQVQGPDGSSFYYRVTAKGAGKIGAGANSSRTRDVMQILSSASKALKVR